MYVNNYMTEKTIFLPLSHPKHKPDDSESPENIEHIGPVPSIRQEQTGDVRSTNVADLGATKYHGAKPGSFCGRRPARQQEDEGWCYRTLGGRKDVLREKTYHNIVMSLIQINK